MSEGKQLSVAEIVRQNPDYNYFISASAGTGKTYTLTEYFLGILEKYELQDPNIVDKILAVTFTRKAAADMANKIIEKIEGKIRELEERNETEKLQYWRKVLSSMSRANISTIDSFCRKVLLEKNVEIGVDPDFQIMNKVKENRKTDIAVYQAMRIVFEYIDKNDPEELESIRTFRRSRKEKIIELLKEWDTKELRESLLHLIEKLEKIEKLEEIIIDLLRNWRTELDIVTVSEKIETKLEKASKSLKVIVLISKIAKQIYLSITVDENEYDFKGVLEKTLEIFRNNQKIREYYAKKFKYIIIDEYQDTNFLQKKIFDYIHTNENYIFLVGDRKQSIYRFRGADVSVFLKTMNEFEEKERNGENYKSLALNRNYRSLQPLVDYFNEVSEKALFNKQIVQMVTETNNSTKSKKKKDEEGLETQTISVNHYEVFEAIDGTTYRKLWFLEDDRCNADKQDPGEFPVPDLEKINEDGAFDIIKSFDSQKRVMYLTVGKEKDAEKVDNTTLEAEVMARIIKDLLGKKIVRLKDGKAVEEEVSYKDFVILRSRLVGAETIFKEVFRKHNIPLFVYGSKAFYERPEVQYVINLLQLIQNPNNNYFFVHSFFSPFFNGNIEIFKKLVNIYLSIKETTKEKASLFQILKSEEMNEYLKNIGRGDIVDMVNLIEKYSELKYFVPPSEILRGVIKEGNYFEKLANSIENYEGAVLNVKKLISEAYSFDALSPSFAELISLLTKINETDESEASILSEESDVVKLMTIHASKGLEFPIVFLGDLFGESEDRNNDKIVIHYEDEQTVYISLETLLDEISKEGSIDKAELWQIYKEIKIGQVYSETEANRKLYVALTRAKEMLINVVIPAGTRTQRPLSSLIIPAYSDLTTSSKATLVFKGFQKTESIEQEKETVEKEFKVIEKHIEDLTHLAYSKIIAPTKLLSQAQIAGFKEKEAEELFEEAQERITTDFEKLFKESEESETLKKGSIIHRRLASVEKFVNLETLVHEGLINEKLLSESLLKDLFDSADRIFSEWRLAKYLNIDGKEYLIFGVPDKVFLIGDGFVVLDFKTGQVRKHLENYTFQLQFYSYLLSDIRPVKKAFVVAVDEGRLYEIPVSDERFEERLVEIIRKLSESEVKV